MGSALTNFAPGKNAMGVFLAVVATFIWSGNFIAAKFLAPFLTAEGMVFWRWLLAALIMLPFGFRAVCEHWNEIKKHFLLLNMYAFIGMTLANILYYSAPATATAVNMVILAAVAPLFMMLYARILFGEAFTPRRVLGAGIAFFGVITLVSKGDLTFLTHFTFTPGDVWTLGGALCFSFYSVALRYNKLTISLSGFLCVLFSLGFLWSIPFYLLDGQEFVLPSTPTMFLGVLYIGCFASCVAFTCWNAAIARIGAVRAGIIYYLLPVFGAAEALLLLNESLSLAQVIGGILVLGGVVFSSLPNIKWAALSQRIRHKS